jgi:hypothetical protein
VRGRAKVATHTPACPLLPEEEDWARRDKGDDAGRAGFAPRQLRELGIQRRSAGGPGVHLTNQNSRFFHRVR